MARPDCASTRGSGATFRADVTQVKTGKYGRTLESAGEKWESVSENDKVRVKAGKMER